MSAICWCHSANSVCPDLLLQHFRPNSVCPELLLQHFRTNSICPEMLLQHFRTNWKFCETNRFFAGFTYFFVPFFALRQSLCTWHGYFEKTSVRACFFWLQRPLIQSSAAPQGSPPPTQQIKIQMKTSWVGWSTNNEIVLAKLISTALIMRIWRIISWGFAQFVNTKGWNYCPDLISSTMEMNRRWIILLFAPAWILFTRAKKRYLPKQRELFGNGLC